MKGKMNRLVSLLLAVLFTLSSGLWAVAPPAAPALADETDPCWSGCARKWTNGSPVGDPISANAGNSPYVQAYAQQTLNGAPLARVISQQDAYGHTTTLAYDPAAYRATETRPDGADVTYEHYSHHGLPESVTDAAGQTIQFGRDEETNRPTSVTDRLGDTTSMAYHETGKLAAYTDAEGRTTAYSYTPQAQTFTNPANAETVSFTFYDLTRVEYADGVHEEFVYDGQGNVLTYTDPEGQTWTFTYNVRGQPLTSTTPQGGVSTYTYNPDASLASSTDSDVGLTTYSYDAYKRLERIIHPGGSFVQFTYDLNDQVTSVTDELDHPVAWTYDPNGNLLTSADPLSQTTTYAHDLMDRLTSVTDPVGQVSNLSYDEMSRLETVTDRNGHTWTYGYDPRGWLTGVTDPLGHTWTTTYDDEGVPTANATPLGHTTTFQTNKLGYPTAITDPLGAVSHLGYDELGRLTSFTDRLGRTTAYEYDAAGRLVGVTKSGLGAATYTRNDLGQLTGLTDLRGQTWAFGYSPMGRLISHTDPLGHQWTYSYDARGRLQQTDYPGGLGAATYTYDDASQVTQMTYPGGPTLDFSYDAAGQLLTADKITLTYDQRGNVTNSQDGAAAFGATYDAGQRLETVTYNGQATVSYTYDARDQLIRVEDDLSGAWLTLTYDADGRLTGISRSSGANTAFEYDAAGRVTAIHDGALADQVYTLNAEGEPIQVVRTLPLDPPPAVPDLSLTFDAAGQISSPGYAYDARGRQTAKPGATFTYDGATRLTQISSDTLTVDLAYNGLGDLRTRTTGGATTTYYHNYALGLAPIIAEPESPLSILHSPLSQYKRFYVYTPGGSLLYSLDPATGDVRFYHYDRLGSTLFLSNGAGSVTDAYAYDPYGNPLGHTGGSDQPFTYVGRYGVRWEPVGGLYDMRARHYDPAAARFLSRDPVWPTLAEPESLNPYQYANQNPLHYIDPLGTQPAHIFGGLSDEQEWTLDLGTTVQTYMDYLFPEFHVGDGSGGTPEGSLPEEWERIHDMALTKNLEEYIFHPLHLREVMSGIGFTPGEEEIALDPNTAVQMYIDYLFPKLGTPSLREATSKSVDYCLVKPNSEYRWISPEERQLPEICALMEDLA
jgi:RHS repeat-associated protein